MKQQQNQSKASFELVRQAPGVSQRVQVKRTDTEIAISFSPDKFAVPQQGIVADYAEAVAGVDGVKLLFAKEHPISHSAVLLVEVAISWSSFEDAIWPSFVGGDFLEKLGAHVRETYKGWEPPPITDLAEAQYHSRRATFVNVAYSRDEACVDFHLVSTADMSLVILGRGVDVAVDAVLRVLLSTPLLHKMLTDCEKIAQRRGAKVRK